MQEMLQRDRDQPARETVHPAATRSTVATASAVLREKATDPPSAEAGSSAASGR